VYEGARLSKIVPIGSATLSRVSKGINKQRVINVVKDKSVFKRTTCLGFVLDPAIRNELYNRWIYTPGSAYEGARFCKTLPIGRPSKAIVSWVPKPVPETIIDQWKDMSIFKIRTSAGVLRDPVNLMTHILPITETINVQFFKITNKEWYVLLSEAYFPLLNHGRILYAECFELIRRYYPLIKRTIRLFIQDCKDPRFYTGWIPIIRGLVINPFRDLRIFKTETNNLIRQWDITVSAHIDIFRNEYLLLNKLTYKLWDLYGLFATRTLAFSREFCPIAKDTMICVGSYIYNLSSDLYPVILRTGNIFAKDCYHFHTKIRPLIRDEYPIPHSLKVLVNTIIDNRKRLNLNIINGLKLGAKKILTLNIREILAFDIHGMLTVSTRNITLPFNFPKIFMKILGRVVAVKSQKQLFYVVPLIINSQVDKFMLYYFDLELGQEPPSLTRLFKHSKLVLSVTPLFVCLSKDKQLFVQTKQPKSQKSLAVCFPLEVRLVGLAEKVLEKSLALCIPKPEDVMLFRLKGQAFEQAWNKKLENELEKELAACFSKDARQFGQLEKVLAVCFSKQGSIVPLTYRLTQLQKSLEMSLASCFSKDVERKRFTTLEKKLEATLTELGSPKYQKYLENSDLVEEYITHLCWFEEYFDNNYESNKYQILDLYMSLLTFNYLGYENNVCQPLKDRKYHYEKLKKFYEEWHPVFGKKEFKRFEKLAAIYMIICLAMTK